MRHHSADQHSESTAPSSKKPTASPTSLSDYHPPSHHAVHHTRRSSFRHICSGSSSVGRSSRLEQRRLEHRPRRQRRRALPEDLHLHPRRPRGSLGGPGSLQPAELLVPEPWMGW